MTWRWDIEDLALRVAIARSESPRDILTMIARFIVVWTTSFLGIILKPVDYAVRFIGIAFTALVIPFMFLALLDIIWMGVWGLLVFSSRVWLNVPLARPLLILPGMVLAIVAHVFIMIAPDPNKVSAYASVPQEWPLTWHLWKPPPAYFEHPDAMYKPF